MAEVWSKLKPTTAKNPVSPDAAIIRSACRRAMPWAGPGVAVRGREGDPVSSDADREATGVIVGQHN